MVLHDISKVTQFSLFNCLILASKNSLQLPESSILILSTGYLKTFLTDILSWSSFRVIICFVVSHPDGPNDASLADWRCRHLLVQPSLKSGTFLNNSFLIKSIKPVNSSQLSSRALGIKRLIAITDFLVPVPFRKHLQHAHIW